MIRKINLSTRTEDKKGKKAGPEGWRVKEGSESTLGCEGSAQRGCEQIWGGGGTQADLERLLHTEGWASAGDMGEMPKAFRTRRQESRVRMRGVRADTSEDVTGIS